jgi:hypothetical protein
MNGTEYDQILARMTDEELDAEMERSLQEIHDAAARIAWCDRIRGGAA